MSTTSERVEAGMASLTVAAMGAITDLSDVQVRGYLKEHPAHVLHRLDLLTDMIGRVCSRALEEEVAWRREEVANGWDLPDPAADHAQMVAEYREHEGCCPWCLICRGHEDGQGDEIWAAWQEKTGSDGRRDRSLFW
jgi:hypothetical protein